ncbi:hypothetical protein [Acinetobacter sp. A47]|uniref:hypothetical protein n=1 Tax=Acinetobacter sp. A47 TaxID=1561217 RepID=UPI00056F0E50|nr:hypothetical protein [Acinetobacter sp. A47]
MAKYDNTVSMNNSNTASGNSREKAKAWVNLTLRLKDGASTNIGIPLMESDYVQRSIMRHLSDENLTAEERDSIIAQVLTKAITSGDISYRIVAERDENAVGELNI